VLFDCDRVLVDSDPIANGVLREVHKEVGWVLSEAECLQIFIGKAVRDERLRLSQAPTGPRW
jgi:beta-phosphoglucomutase-like phosphatase (HAD superfamily)